MCIGYEYESMCTGYEYWSMCIGMIMSPCVLSMNKYWYEYESTCIGMSRVHVY